MPRPVPPRPATARSKHFRYQLVGWLGAGFLRMLGASWRIGYDIPESVRRLESDGEQVVYAFWHQHLLSLVYAYRDRSVVVLVSESKDGEIISQILHRLGSGTARGSSSRGGLRALHEAIRQGRAGSPLAITPDGPRGPRQVLQAGVLLIAQRAGLPIVPLAAAATPEHRLRSWDRFEIPLPFSRVRIFAGEPIVLPAEGSPEEIQRRFEKPVEAAFHALEQAAEVWKATHR